VTQERVAAYFASLLAREVTDSTILHLSSAQRVRTHAWLKANAIAFDQRLLDRPFTVSQLLGESRRRGEPPQAVAVLDEVGLGSTAGIDCGVDIQCIAELFPQGLPSDPKSDAELLEMFSLREISYAQAKPNPAHSLAGLFAAKEAIVKCSGQGVTPLASLEILPNAAGRPQHPEYSISISHSRDYAVAVALRRVARGKDAQASILQTSASPPSASQVRARQRVPVISILLGTLVLVLAALEAVRLIR
jgi:phosphopantetheinyl transferase (holo-ACP synthase)